MNRICLEIMFELPSCFLFIEIYASGEYPSEDDDDDDDDDDIRLFILVALKDNNLNFELFFSPPFAFVTHCTTIFQDP